MKKYSLKLIIAQSIPQERTFIKEEIKRNLARIFNIKNPIELERKYRHFRNVRYLLRKQWMKENPDKIIQEDTISDQAVYDDLKRSRTEPRNKTHPQIIEELRRIEKLYSIERNANFIKKFSDFKYRILKLPETQRLEILPIENPTDFDILTLFEQTLKDRITIKELIQKKRQIKKDIVETDKKIKTEKRKTFREKLEEIYGPLTDKEFFDAKNNFRQRKFKLMHHPLYPRPDITNDEVLQHLKDKKEQKESTKIKFIIEEEKRKQKLLEKQEIINKLQEEFGPLTEQEMKQKLVEFTQTKYRIIRYENPDIKIENPTIEQIIERMKLIAQRKKTDDTKEENNTIANLISNIKLAHILDSNGYYEEADNLFSYINTKNIYKIK